ncbi:class I SAM-dependent methyltransferase [Deinococcus cellulosilyticus]|uniref:Methyltransferase n=1 Tax=Deinococcus cellulosilyticus (strain DSM 18568 / NBRC 106333 / KACC 11606 / 5516J-15) TaxID=1223518 RepID=A0A511MXM1_DEIC1|nr:class I SAM-dependent methyltransferase [Deinococcus cellulosilyticus]GEM45345.1 methyltransferase [Deinococcus cellulosilyticus NBRC 106333 = KACC 11606]
MTDAIRAYHDPDRARRYHTQHAFDPPRKARMFEVMLDTLRALIPAGGRVLELGAGSGDFTKVLLDSGFFSRIEATDGAEEMLSLAQSEITAEQVSFRLLDFTRPWSAPEPLDAIVSSMALHHAPDKLFSFQQAFQALRPGGVLVIGDHIAGATPHTHRLISLERARVKQIPEAQVPDWILQDEQAQAAQGNICEPLDVYLNVLQQAGFMHVDCLWRDHWMAVVLALKPYE